MEEHDNILTTMFEKSIPILSFNSTKHSDNSIVFMDTEVEAMIDYIKTLLG